MGASRGIITIWKSSLLAGNLVYQNEYAISISFTSRYNGDEWLLTNIYGPSTHKGNCNFIEWLKNIHMPDHIDWLLVGDFNLMR